MKIESGSTRKVLVLNSFVLKFPIFRQPDWKALTFVLRLGVNKYIWPSRKFEPGLSETFMFFDRLGICLSPLTDGILSNWLEFYYYIRTRNSFLIPTYFSFLGLINIQKKIVVIKIDRSGRTYPFGELFLIVDKYYCYESISLIAPFCHHMLKESYSWDDDGHLTMFDYGNKSVFPFILEKGEEIHRKFYQPVSQ